QSLNPAISAAANQLVLRLLRKDVKQRFETYDELIEAIEGVAQSKGAPKLKAAPAAPARAVPVRRFPWAGAIAAIVLLGGGAAGLMFLRQPAAKSPANSETRTKPAAESEVELLLKSVAALEQRTQENPAEIPSVRARWKELLEQFKATPHLAALVR